MSENNQVYKLQTDVKYSKIASVDVTKFKVVENPSNFSLVFSNFYVKRPWFELMTKIYLSLGLAFIFLLSKVF